MLLACCLRIPIDRSCVIISEFAPLPAAMAPTGSRTIVLLVLFVLCAISGSLAQDCGLQKGGARCGNGFCCSQYGYCGTSGAYCGTGCQSNCPGPAPGGATGVGAIVTSAIFDKLFPNRNSFYTYSAFLTAAQSYPSFGTEGTQAQKLREIAAFAAHVQQETAGLFYITEIDQSNSYCDSSNTQYPCAPGQKYFGRGPLQLSWNSNYGAARASVGYDILANPGQVAADPILAFKTSLWYWTTPSGNKPSVHNALVGKWTPSAADISAGRRAGFGVTIDIINGGIECGKATAQAANRVTYFKQFSAQLGVDPGQNLDCASMKPF